MAQIPSPPSHDFGPLLSLIAQKKKEEEQAKLMQAQNQLSGLTELNPSYVAARPISSIVALMKLKNSLPPQAQQFLMQNNQLDMAKPEDRRPTEVLKDVAFRGTGDIKNVAQRELQLAASYPETGTLSPSSAGLTTLLSKFTPGSVQKYLSTFTPDMPEGDARVLKAHEDVPKTLEEILSKEVSNGNLKLEEAYSIKQNREKNLTPTFEKDLETEATRLNIPEDKKFEWKQEQRLRVAASRAAETTRARIENTPLPAQTQKEVAALEYLKNLSGLATDLYSPDYVGPIDAKVPALFLSDDENTFRRTVRDIQDALLRVRSGAQINEQEFQRLRKLTADLQNFDNQFLSNLNSFSEALNGLIENRIRLAQTPSGSFSKEKESKKPDPLGIR